MSERWFYDEKTSAVRDENRLEVAFLSDGHSSGRDADGRLLAAAPELADAALEALPWLIRLGDLIGNGTPEDPDGRCRAVFALRTALRNAGLADDRGIINKGES